jgi:hypothetical protein
VKSVLVISERDTVATALVALERGARLEIRGAHVTVLEPIAPGHKVAIAAIRAGDPVVKYGSPIGIATADIPPGAHVHTHNVMSTRGRGDLGGAASGTAAAAPVRVPSEPDDAGASERESDRG